MYRRIDSLFQSLLWLSWLFYKFLSHFEDWTARSILKLKLKIQDNIKKYICYFNPEIIIIK